MWFLFFLKLKIHPFLISTKQLLTHKIKYKQNISTTKLNILQYVHTLPIYVIIYYILSRIIFKDSFLPLMSSAVNFLYT